jgi:regulator of sigma E protease
MLWIGAIIAIGLLIVVHEGGHFIVARWCKMRVDRFSLGFGPAIWSFNRGGTQFQIAPIPFGGFVQINGMLIADEVDDDDPYAYPNRPAWQRFATIFAGPATNYLFAVVLAIGLYSCAGVPSGTSWYVVDKAQTGFDADGKLQSGDKIIAINDELVYVSYEGKSQKGLLERIQPTKDQPIKVTVERNGEKMDFQVAPKLDKDSKGNAAYRLGIELMVTEERVDIGPFRAIGHALWYPVAQTKLIVVGLYKIATKQAEGRLTGPVGITTAIKRHIEVGWIAVIQLLMVLNVYLGLFNLFPLPALDGGRLVFLTYEMATRRRANPKIEATVHMVGIMALLVLMVLVTYKDIARLF